MISDEESSVDLDCSSCPRCLVAFTVTAPQNPAKTSSNDRTNDTSSPTEKVPTNPFEAAAFQSVSSHYLIPRFSIVYGTERGSLHYRTYPLTKSVDIQRQNVSSLHPHLQPVDWTGTPGGVFQTGAIVGCIRARINQTVSYNVRFPPPQLSNPTAIGSDSHDTATSLMNNSSAQVFLVLRDDNRGAGGSQSSSPGAYTSSLLLLQHGTFTGLTSLPSPLTNHHSAYTTTTVGCLPRMSCAAYHPSSGFVYAAGTSVCSLTPIAMYAVSSSLANNTVAPYSSYYIPTSSYESTTNIPVKPSTVSLSSSVGTNVNSLASKIRSVLPTVFFEAKNVLPSPGARSTGSGCTDAMALVCQGRVAIVPVGNTFWAVPGITIPEKIINVWSNLINATTNASSSTLPFSMSGSDENSISNTQVKHDSSSDDAYDRRMTRAEKILTFNQSSQVHPAIAVELSNYILSSSSRKEDDRGSVIKKAGDIIGDQDLLIASLLFLASGRECAVVEIMYDSKYFFSPHSSCTSIFVDGTIPRGDDLIRTASGGGPVQFSSPRYGIVTLGSAILSAVGLTPKDPYGPSTNGNPLVAILTSDGLIDIRSFPCIAIPLSTVELGNRPNDYFMLRSLHEHKVLALSYSGQAKIISCRPDTPQDMADRLVKLSIDAFGCDGFPRVKLAAALGASFSATAYTGTEQNALTKNTLRQYLQYCLGLDIIDEIGSVSHITSYMGELICPAEDSFQASYFLAATAILCLLCTQLATPNAALANRAAKACATKIGVVSFIQLKGVHDSVVPLIEETVDSILREASNFVLLNPSSSTVLHSNSRLSKGLNMDIVESTLWLLRACGHHERAINTIEEYMNNPSLRNKIISSQSGTTSQKWSQAKFETFIASYLSDLWNVGDDACKQIVLSVSVTHQLLEDNPKLGLQIFISNHPEKKEQWVVLQPEKDPLFDSVYPCRVIQLLKSISPRMSQSACVDETPMFGSDASSILPLDSGTALAVTYLESAIGIATGRPYIAQADLSISAALEQKDDQITELHDELAYLLLEGIISERGDKDDEPDSKLGSIYRKKLHRLLSWPNAVVRSERLMTTLPASFLRERALLLGRLGRHEDALRILYCDLNSLDSALAYCDARHELKITKLASERLSRRLNSSDIEKSNIDCVYLPLVSVILNTSDVKRGISAAINVLSLRRRAIDHTAALSLLPKNLPLSVIARPYLIPALVENESEVRRLTMALSLVRAKYTRLQKLQTERNIQLQANINLVPMLRNLNLGETIHISKPLKVRPVRNMTICPDVVVVKYFYPRYLVLQVKIANTRFTSSYNKSLDNVAFLVAESSDDALVPSISVPISTLPPKMTGTCWFVLAASPQRLDGATTLTCELRYTIHTFDTVAFTGVHDIAGPSRLVVEELEDIEIRRTEFDY